MQEFFLEYGVEAAWSIVVVALIACYKCLAGRVHKQATDERALKDGTLALLRSEIIHCYDNYCARGWIPLYAVENVLELYGAYSVLGGNGAVTKLVDELKALPSQDHCK